MKRLILAAAIVFAASSASAAPLHAPCTEASVTSAECDPVNSSNPLPVTSAPGSAAALGISSKTTTTAAASSLVLKASAGNFYGAQVNTGASAVWVLLVDGTADAGNGAVSGCGTGAHAAGCVAKWWQVPANSTLGVSAAPPIAMTTGAVLVCSSTGPFTETQSATCTFSGEVQ